MKKKLWVPLGLILYVLVISVGFSEAKNLTPGTYENWGGSINRLDIVRSFKIMDYAKLIIQDLDTANIQYLLDGFAEDTKANLVQQGTRILIDKSKNNPQHLDITVAKDGNSDKTLIYKISILEIGVKPGSVWWNPMAWVTIQGELIGPQNNEVFLKFKTTRTSTVKGVAGGSVIKDLDEEGKKLVVSAIHNDFKELGEDLNELIFSFK